MSTVLHDGPEEGLYDRRFQFRLGKWDDEKVRINEIEGNRLHYKAFLPKYGVTVICETTMGENCKVEVDGHPIKVSAFRAMIEKEQSELLTACAEG